MPDRHRPPTCRIAGSARLAAVLAGGVSASVGTVGFYERMPPGTDAGVRGAVGITLSVRSPRAPSEVAG